MGAMEVMTSSLGEGAGLGRGAIGGIAATVTGIGVALKSFTSIPEGSVGVKTRFNKARRDKDGNPIIRGPGPRLTFPGVHSYRIVSTRMRSTDLEHAHVEMANEDGVIEKRNLAASILWFVSPEGDAPYRALFEVEDESFTQLATNTCLAALRASLHRRSIAVLDNQDELFQETRARCKEVYDKAGFVLKALNVKDVTQSEAQVITSGSFADNTPPNKGVIAAIHTNLRSDAESA